MKHGTLKSKEWVYCLVLSLFFIFCSISGSAAVTYCSPSAFGYGSSAAGGGSATPVLVSSVSELQSALNKGKNKVIIITQNLTFTTCMKVQDGSNVTLMGLPGVTLTSLQQDKSNSGILYVKRFDNLIIRNLTFVGPGAYDCDGWDLLCFENVTNAWVDHCDFQDGCDGNFDNKAGTDNVTVSWCRFRYLKDPKSGGSGGAADHRFTNLLGSSSSDKPSDGTYNLTWAYCWWDEGCRERMLRCRNASLHFLNCYWNSSVANYYIGPENADCYIEGCTFEGAPKTAKIFYQNYGGSNGAKFINCTAAKGLPSNVSNRTVVTPGYTYTALTAAEAKTAVTNATCGAGATLTVTTAGAVSSTCDGSAPLPTVYTVTWDATTNGGTCGTATSSVTSDAAVGSLPEASRDGYNFDGWFTKASGGAKITSATTVTDDVTYYAQFTSAPVTVYYTVIWDANGGSCATPSTEVESGNAIGTLPDATMAGDYTFDGWYTATAGGTKILATTTVTGNVTYYAHYIATGGGGGGCETLVQGTKNTSTNATIDATIGTIAHNGSIAADNGSVKLGNASANFALTAKSGSSPIVAGDKLTVTMYNKDDGAKTLGFRVKASDADTHTTSVDGKSTGNVVYTLASTDIESDGTVKIFRSSSSDHYEAILLERCGGSTPTPPTFVLSYDENGGTGTMADEEQTGSSVTVDANGFTAPTGYAFQEWNGNMNGGGTVYTDGQVLTLTEDLTIYAIWQPNTYTVTLNAGDGTGGSPSVTATFDEALPNITVPAQSGYVFKGYYTEADGAGTQYYDENGSSTNNWTIPSATTLNAYWEAGSTPDPTGCDLHFWFFASADAGTNGKTNDGTVFTAMVSDGSNMTGSITIDGTSYSVTRRTGDNATFGSFTVPSGYTGTFYALAVSSGSGDRQINLVGATQTYELDVPGGSDSYKRLESEELPAGTYSIQREGSSNVRLGVVVVKLCTALPPSAAPTITGQPAGDTYCAGDAVVPLSVTANNSGSGGTLSYQWKKDGVNIPSANSETYPPTETGMYACVVTNEETGKSPTSLSSDVVEVIINGAVAAPTMSQTDNTVTITTATVGATIYYTTDGTNPATTSASGTSVKITADCTVKAFAEKDGCASSITSFAATFDSSVKECVTLISYTLSESGTATPAIPADENNLVGGSADYKVSSTSTDGGYKLNSDQYFGLTLASGQFKAGDKVTVTITKASDQGDLGLHLSASKTGAAVASIAAGDVVVGDNVFTLTADCDAIYVARSSSCNQNPYVKSISVCRELSKYTVTFNKNNASASGTMSVQSFYEGFAAKLTANSFSLTDYDFAGWATDPSGSKVYDDKQSVTMTGNITLYAIWEPAKYTLTNAVNPAGYGTVDVASVDNITPGTTTTSSANTYTVNGTTVTATPAATTAEYTYAFDSWSDLPATVTADVTVTANFTRTARTYNVTLNTNGGTINAGNVTSYTYGTGATLPTDVSNSGADFGGWYDNSSLSGSAVTEVSGTDTGDKAYWAKWIVCPADNSGETVYRFVTKNEGLGTDNVCAVKDTDYPMSTSNALSELIGGTLTARSNGSVNRLKYKTNAFTFANGEGGVLRVDLDCPIRTGDVIRFINSATNTGYNAYVRHTSSSTTTDQINLAGKNPTIAIIQMPDGFTGKKTLYIVRGENNNALISYFEIVRPLAITLDAQTNGGKVGGENTQLLYSVSGETLVLPHATKDGFRFKGWYDAPSGGNAAANPYTVSTAATLYAQFEDCPTYGLLYKFEVGTGLTNGSVTENNVAFEFTEANYLTTLIGGTLTTGGSAASNVKIANNNAISIESSSSAYIRVDMDCPLEEGDIFKSTVSNNPSWVTSTPSSANTAILPKGTLTQTPVPAVLAGATTLYIWRGDGNTRIQYFEITRPKLTQITLSAVGAYNKYTTSVVAMYEQAMPEVATLPLRTGYVFGGYYDEPNGAGTQYYNGKGAGMRTWDKEDETATLYAHWVAPCDMEPTLEKVVPVATIWDGQGVDMSLVHLSCDYDTTGIHYSLQSASEAISGCTYAYEDERIYIKGTPALGNTSTVTKTITFTMTNDCSPAHIYTVDATIRIYPAGQRAKIAYIITGTKGGGFDDYSTANESASSDLLTYLRTFYTVDCVNGYATKDPTAIANFYKDYDLLIVTDFLSTPEGYTNAIGTLIDQKPILSFEAYVAGENGSNWHINSNPKDPSPKVQDMKILCAGHAIFGDAEGVDVINDADTTVHVLSSLSSEADAKGLQGFVINEAPDYIFLATVKDADNKRDLIVCCERQVVFPARLMLYGINFYEMDNLSPAGRVVMHQMINYLLMTDESKIADCSLVFDNGAGNDGFNPSAYSGTGVKGDGKWSTAANWAPGYNIIPTPYHPTRIIAECHVDNDKAHAGSVKVNKGRDALGNVVDGKVVVEPYGGLTVAGMVAKVNDTRYASPITIKAEDLIIKADETGNGSFVYGNKESDVRATVQYYSRGEGANTANPVWQYIGIPFQASKTAINMYYEAWMCRWSSISDGALGGLWQWVENNDVLVPFEGYCITQEARKTYTFTGKLNAPITTTIDLDNYDPADGFAFAANSWTAPIKIQEMKDEDFTDAERAIYLYHAGSYAAWESKKDDIINPKTSATTPVPGQYVTIPIHSSPYLGADSVIPAMQGFFIKTTSASASLALVYNRVVYDATYFKTSTQPMRAPRRAAQDNAPEVMVLTVAGDKVGGDRVHILSRPDFSENYEDGWDGRKLAGDEALPMLSIVKGKDSMAVAAIPTADERELIFRAGEDSVYTFYFDYEGETMYLYDRLTGEATEIQTGNTYSFEATNKTPMPRFLITANPPKMPTGIGSLESESLEFREAQKMIIDGMLFILRDNRFYDARGVRVTELKRKEGTQ